MTSLRLRTELMFWERTGRVVDRGEYLVVETPSNPTFYFGNMLVFRRPPSEGDFERWTETFGREFAHNPAVRHMNFEWEVEGGATGEIEPFLEAGFRRELSVALVARGVHPPLRPNPDVEVRPLASAAEWEAALENQILCRSPQWSLEGYTPFIRERMGRYRALADEGLGAWYGAFLGGRLVGDLGLYREREVARFQHVGTHPDFRRRGVCGTLVYEVSRRALAEPGLEALVMVADEEYHAARIYESVGFEPAERAVAVYRVPDRAR
jgi:RimJ/RimL family protein N-acetyltransferase